MDIGRQSSTENPSAAADLRTEEREYAARLQAKQHVWWKRALNVQAPYRHNLRRQRLGRTLDVGCGIGRQLGVLDSGSVGVDHNRHAVDVARQAGHVAYTVEEFLASSDARLGAFDGMLLAHVVEHMERDEGLQLVRFYLPYVRPGGTVMVICPQERGFRSDPTHVLFYDGDDLVRLAGELGLIAGTWWSFPFPRALGRHFVYNEVNLVATIPAG